MLKKHNQIKIVKLIKKIYNKKREDVIIITTQEYLSKRKIKGWKFLSIIEKDAFLDVNLIHPLMQKKVKEIVDAAHKDPFVRRVIIFGSSIRYDCDITSDLDICIDWKEKCYDNDGVLNSFTRNMRRVISKVTQGRADVVNYGYLDDTDIKDAVNEGVVVYEYNV